MVQPLPNLPVRFLVLLLLLAGLGLSVGLSLERQVLEKKAAEQPQATVQDQTQTNSCSAEIPGQPQNLRGWAGPGEGQASLVWDQVGGISDYRLDYTQDLSFWRYQVTNLNQSQTYTATGLEPGQVYYFQILALNDCADSEPSQIVKLTSYTDGVDKTVIYAADLDQTQFAVEVPVESDSRSEEQEATPAAESPEEATPVAELETTPKVLETPAEPGFNWSSLFQGVGPWLLGAVVVWGIISLIRARIKQVSQETTDLSQGTEIPIEPASTVLPDSEEASDSESASMEPDRPAVEPPADS